MKAFINSIVGVLVVALIYVGFFPISEREEKNTIVECREIQLMVMKDALAAIFPEFELSAIVDSHCFDGAAGVDSQAWLAFSIQKDVPEVIFQPVDDTASYATDMKSIFGEAWREENSCESVFRSSNEWNRKISVVRGNRSLLLFAHFSEVL